MYVGAIPRIALNANNKILNKCAALTEANVAHTSVARVIWLKRGAHQTSLAAVFKTRWTLLSCEAGRLYKRLLQ